MPLAGWMLIKEQSLPVSYTLIAGLYGALGNTIGSIIAYVVGIRGGRPFLEKYAQLQIKEGEFASTGTSVSSSSRCMYTFYLLLLLKDDIYKSL